MLFLRFPMHFSHRLYAFIPCPDRMFPALTLIFPLFSGVFSHNVPRGTLYGLNVA